MVLLTLLAYGYYWPMDEPDAQLIGLRRSAIYSIYIWACGRTCWELWEKGGANYNTTVGKLCGGNGLSLIVIVFVLHLQ